jgi:hypothetical protein
MKIMDGSVGHKFSKTLTCQVCLNNPHEREKILASAGFFLATAMHIVCLCDVHIYHACCEVRTMSVL